MKRKFNCSKEQAMQYEYIERMEKILGRRIELPKELKVINKRITEGLYHGIIIMGPAGSGKNTYADLMARELNAPVFQLSFTSGTCLDDFYRSQTFSEPIEKGGFLVIDGMEFCRENVLRQLEKWFLPTPTAGQKLEKPKLDDLLDIPEYTVSPNFILVLILNPDYLGQNYYEMSMAWVIDYPTIAVNGGIFNPFTSLKVFDKLINHEPGLGDKIN